MRKPISIAAAGVTAAICVPFAGAHATVNLLLGQATTASTATWFLRVPNERLNKSTFRVSMTVPTAIQQSISVRQTPGQKDGEGTAITNTTRVTWQALPGKLIIPGMYAAFEFRFKAPATPGRLCFTIDQTYNGAAKGMAAETVSWSGHPDSRTPASCVVIAA